MKANLKNVDVINKLISNGYHLMEIVSDDQYYFRNDKVFVCYVTPHRDIKFKHLIRAELISNFNNWGDASYEVFISKKYKIFDVLKHLDELSHTGKLSGDYEDDEIL